MTGMISRALVLRHVDAIRREVDGMMVQHMHLIASVEMTVCMLLVGLPVPVATLVWLM